MARTFPWPVTEDELILANALDDVMAAYGNVGETEEAWVREVSAKLIRVCATRTCLRTMPSKPWAAAGAGFDAGGTFYHSDQ